ncbi:alpha/beta hydrolase [Pelagibius marinus]|uniref:alpha/beta hydrolase n=1 Tax=Pelagibius marinus TaxID=2762760 RepID=UPI001D05521E|nr:alpha/beta hydrolase [Pelagibius marinus]
MANLNLAARLPALLLIPLLIPLLILGACAPRVAPPGPGLAATGLTAPAFTEENFITADGTELPLRHWAPREGEAAARGVVLALHGFNDYSHAFAESGPALAAQGLLVYAYDQRGFGEAPHRGLWAGVEVLTGDLAEAAALLRRRHPGLPLYLLGESMGGAVILAALGGPDARPEVSQADGVILAAPAVWARSTMPFHQRAALWLGARLFPWAKFTGRGLGIQASDNIEMLRALGRDPLFIKETRTDAIYGLVNLMDAALAAAPEVKTPTLLLYGEKDEVVPAEPVFAFWRHLPPEAETRTPGRRRFALYPEGWHMLLRDLQAQVVIDDIAAWTGDRAAPLPSGAEETAAAALKGAAEGGAEDGEKAGDGAEGDAAAAACEAAAC